MHSTNYTEPVYLEAPVSPTGVSPHSLATDLLRGAVFGDYNENATTNSLVSQVATGLIPVFGQVADLRDTTKAVQDVWNNKSGAWAALGLTAVAWVPGVGDAVKAVAKAPTGLARAVSNTLYSAGRRAQETVSIGLEAVLSRTPRVEGWFTGQE